MEFRREQPTDFGTFCQITIFYLVKYFLELGYGFVVLRPWIYFHAVFTDPVTIDFLSETIG